ncbi:uncharacterized protein LOC111543100 isoform X2 [Piliocolobus tephrosceles]|uniref:uncharacterized protein LOC111543100 isoform X2 n=1 Tax=Piliocolobus tephrosceles TaxID=591936 RepID=UPI001301114F|nr:uncharacterized protein LOC111543100 isoform X2 [Piliocolobus tephrosceles]
MQKALSGHVLSLGASTQEARSYRDELEESKPDTGPLMRLGPGGVGLCPFPPLVPTCPGNSWSPRVWGDTTNVASESDLLADLGTATLPVCEDLASRKGLLDKQPYFLKGHKQDLLPHGWSGACEDCGDEFCLGIRHMPSSQHFPSTSGRQILS